MVTVDSFRAALIAALEKEQDSAIYALTDPNTAGERAAFERGRLAALRDATRIVDKTLKKQEEESE